MQTYHPPPCVILAGFVSSEPATCQILSVALLCDGHCPGKSEGACSHVSPVNGLPHEKVRSAPAIVVLGPAQPSLTLRPACLRGRLATVSIESCDSFVASTIVSIATGRGNQFPGESHPLEVQRLFTQHFFANYIGRAMANARGWSSRSDLLSIGRGVQNIDCVGVSARNVCISTIRRKRDIKQRLSSRKIS